MIEEILLEYGIIGAFLLILIFQNQRLVKKADEREKRLAEVVENNTKVMATFIERTKKRC